MPKEYIDRDAAKNAIYEYICGHTMSKFLSKELLEASKGGAEGAMYEIENVPAADVVSREQFESVKWERDMLADQLAERWIPVTERLPEEWEPVLVRSKYGFTTTALYIGVSGKWRFTSTHEFMVKDSVTHWMPLPEAPEDTK